MHAIVDLQQVAPGDVCFVVAPGWNKDPTHHLISMVQRMRLGQVVRLPGLRSAGSSVNVVHAAIVVDVNASAKKLTLAESAPPGGLREVTLDWGRPEHTSSGIDIRCRYIFYRMRNPHDTARMRDIARYWTAAHAGYANIGAGLAALMPNSPHYFSRCDLVKLAMLAGAQSAQAWPTRAMICSQFVARIWGAIAAANALEKSSCQGTGLNPHVLRRNVARGFPCSTLNVLPACLHAAMSSHKDFIPVGALVPKSSECC